MAKSKTPEASPDRIDIMTAAQLMIADSEHDADMLYIAGLFVPDPFIAIGINGEWHGLFSPLEVGRAEKHSRFRHVHLDSQWRASAKDKNRQGLAAAAAAFLEMKGIRSIHVPGHFPLSYAEQLRQWGFEVNPVDGEMFPSRAVKSEFEIQCLAKAERLTRQAMQQAERFLAACSIGNDGILRAPSEADMPHQRIKSADVRRVIETFLIGKGAMPAHTIVACGREAADPHNIGTGYIRAGKLIIIDIFPRVLATGYWGDMTRTYVKGKADRDIAKMYRTVREGQDIGLSMVRNGVDGEDIHRSILAHFDSNGFSTGIRRGKQQGFFHGTGHGVGLEIHESPRISMQSCILQTGQVVTVEPGLYYPVLGGIRLEDMVVVRADGCENLTRHPRRLEIE
ncbi:MAG TPA: Xaa-Pro peptidase family protein [Mariprofundaceae bacterium]|nr:Xaa-Pro peptidase family protein [Mariprofundaceae bacterium]